MSTTPNLRSRLLTASVIGVGAGVLSSVATRFTHIPAGDFSLSFVSASEWVAGRTPYPPMPDAVPYPLPAVILATPLTALPREAAGGIFFALSCFLLALGLTRSGWTKLWLFASFPFAAACLYTQWSPLAVAAVFFPWIGIAAMKPQLGLSSAIASRDWRSVYVPLLLLLASIAIRPTWIVEWLQRVKGYPHFFPILLSPGWLLLALLPFIKRRDVQILLVAAISPQRWFYDPLILWLIPETENQYLFAAVSSWLGALVWFSLLPHIASSTLWMIMVCALYCPMLVIIVHRILNEGRLTSGVSIPCNDGAD